MRSGPAQSRSTLHLQMGQETVYLLLAISMFVAFVLAARVLRSEEHKDPPIIVLPEAAGYHFPTGSAELSGDFRSRLLTLVVPKVATIGRQWCANVIEVIGHTDEVPLRRRYAQPNNLDRVLLPILTGAAAGAPSASDNIGLGMARAVEVAAVLRSHMGRDYIIVPLSAGPFLRPDDTAMVAGAATPDEQRRRIEVRVRRQVRPGSAPSACRNAR